LLRRFAQDGKVLAWICHGGWAVARAGLVADRAGTTLPRWMERLAGISFRINGRPSIFIPHAYAEVVMRESMKHPEQQFHRGSRTPIQLLILSPGGGQRALVVDRPGGFPSGPARSRGAPRPQAAAMRRELLPGRPAARGR